MIAMLAIMTLVACGRNNDNDTSTEIPSATDNDTSQEQNDSPESEQPQITDDRFASAEDFHFEYDAQIQGVIIIRYIGNDAEVYIPDVIDGNPVKVIGNSAFMGISEIKEVHIPIGVTHIGNNAFGSSALESVTLPDGLLEIESGAFSGTQLTSLEIPDSVTTLGNQAFALTPLTSIVIGNGVTDIDGQFGEAYVFVITGGIHETLTDIVIGDGVETIGSGTFSGYSVLTNVTLGKNVTTIETHAFDRTESLKQIVLPENLKEIEGGAFSQSGLTSILIPGSVISIGVHAFGFCNLVDVAFESNDLNIDSYAFKDNPTLSEESKKRILEINPDSVFG